jgi:hypothetical protein
MLTFVLTDVTGLFDWGVRTHFPAWSTPLIHMSWNVACALTLEATRRRDAREARPNILVR